LLQVNKLKQEQKQSRSHILPKEEIQMARKHYYNLHKTEKKLKRLIRYLHEFKLVPPFWKTVMEDHAKNYEILSKKFLAFLSI
jgi:hypothetical protein